MSELLQIKHLSIAAETQPERLLVNNVNLQVEAGKTTCVVGESGSGKSLTALSIMGLLSSQLQTKSGEISFQGQALNTLDTEQMRKIRGCKIGMIFQEPMTSLNPVLTIGFQIAEPLMVHLGLRGQALNNRVEELLNQVQTAITNLAAKETVQQLLLIKQTEITELQNRVKSLETQVALLQQSL